MTKYIFFFNKLFKRKGIWNIIFLLILLVQILIIIHYGNRKITLFIDEIWTFNLANSYYTPFIGDASNYFNKWMDALFWQNSITVSADHQFCYSSVIFNQAQDVHPPLYYIIINTICSFFPGQFSKWFGIVPNILFFVIIQLVLYTVAKKIFNYKWIALLVCVFYGFSWGNINNIIFIRMYALLTLFSILSFYYHLKLIKEYNIKNLTLGLLWVLLGILTQYYFLIYQFFMSLCFSMLLILKKEYKQIIEYCVGYSVVFISIFAIFPASIQQIFSKSGYRGQEAFYNLKNANFIDRMAEFSHVMDFDLFGNYLKLILILLVVILIIHYILTFYNIKIEKSARYRYFIKFTVNQPVIQINITDNILIIVMAIITSLGYFSIVSKIAPYYTTRYLVIIYPLISLIFIYLYNSLLNIDKKGKIFLFILFIILCCNNTYDANNIVGNNLKFYNVQKQIKQDSIYIVLNQDESWWPTAQNIITMTSVDNSYLIAEKRIGDLKNIKNVNSKFYKKHSAFIHKSSPCKITDEEFAQVLEKMEFQNIRILDKYDGTLFYVEW